MSSYVPKIIVLFKNQLFTQLHCIKRLRDSRFWISKSKQNENLVKTQQFHQRKVRNQKHNMYNEKEFVVFDEFLINFHRIFTLFLTFGKNHKITFNILFIGVGFWTEMFKLCIPNLFFFWQNCHHFWLILA